MTDDEGVVVSPIVALHNAVVGRVRRRGRRRHTLSGALHDARGGRVQRRGRRRLDVARHRRWRREKFSDGETHTLSVALHDAGGGRVRRRDVVVTPAVASHDAGGGRVQRRGRRRYPISVARHSLKVANSELCR